MISNHELHEIYRADLRGRAVAQPETQDDEADALRVRKRHVTFISPAALMQQRLDQGASEWKAPLY